MAAPKKFSFSRSSFCLLSKEQISWVIVCKKWSSFSMLSTFLFHRTVVESCNSNIIKYSWNMQTNVVKIFSLPLFDSRFDSPWLTWISYAVAVHLWCDSLHILERTYSVEIGRITMSKVNLMHWNLFSCSYESQFLIHWTYGENSKQNKYTTCMVLAYQCGSLFPSRWKRSEENDAFVRPCDGAWKVLTWEKSISQPWLKLNV